MRRAHFGVTDIHEHLFLYYLRKWVLCDQTHNAVNFRGSEDRTFKKPNLAFIFTTHFWEKMKFRSPTAFLHAQIARIADHELTVISKHYKNIPLYLQSFHQWTMLQNVWCKLHFSQYLVEHITKICIRACYELMKWKNSV